MKILSFERVYTMHRMAAVLKLKRHQKGQKSLNMKASSKKQISNPRSSFGSGIYRFAPAAGIKGTTERLSYYFPLHQAHRTERELEESGEVSIFAAAT
jgi:hypothetical protein